MIDFPKIDMLSELNEFFVIRKLEKANLKLSDNKDITNVIAKLFNSKSRTSKEWLYVLELNKSGVLKKIHSICDAKGDGLDCDFNTLITPILNSQNPQFILTHNHRSLPVYPSISDYISTLNLKKECAKFGKEIIDHIIWADEKVYSFSERNLI